MFTLPEFIDAGMKFFKGEIVPAEKLVAAQAQIEQLKNDITLAGIDSTASIALSLKNDELLKEIELLKADAVARTQIISVLESNAITAGRQAQQALLAVGVEPVVLDQNTSTIAPKSFIELVKEQVASGKSKAASITFCIRNFKAEYISAKENGDISRL